VPLYDFSCLACGAQFEAQLAPTVTPSCPVCGGFDVKRRYTAFAGPFTVGLRGLAARRSNAVRSAREEQRRQRRAERREQRPDG
jgi:putative FmdB family regulatory protein